VVDKHSAKWKETSGGGGGGGGGVHQGQAREALAAWTVLQRQQGKGSLGVGAWGLRFKIELSHFTSLGFYTIFLIATAHKTTEPKRG
jgi:hypothetical protein